MNGSHPTQFNHQGSKLVSLWNTTYQSLPANRDHVQFIVTGHKAWLLGTYEDDCFRSRWATYMTSEVSFWRKPDDNPQRSGVQSTTPDKLVGPGVPHEGRDAPQGGLASAITIYPEGGNKGHIR